MPLCLPTHPYLTSVRFQVSHNGKLMATGGTDNMVKLWLMGSGELIMDGVGHSGEVRDLKFSPDDRQVVSVGLDGCIFVWNIYEM